MLYPKVSSRVLAGTFVAIVIAAVYSREAAQMHRPQWSDRLPLIDAEEIADALRAGPAFITKDATLLDWPSAPGGEYRRGQTRNLR